MKHTSQDYIDLSQHSEVSIRLQCPHKVVDDGKGSNTFFVCGEGKELGNWKPENAQPLEYVGKNEKMICFETPVFKVPTNNALIYKFVLRTCNGDYEWEPCPNRVREIPNDVVDVTYTDSWAVIGDNFSLRTDGTAIVGVDGYLAPFEGDLRDRYNRYQHWLRKLGSLKEFSMGYTQFGLNRAETRGGVVYKEWAPGATSLSLVGDFNNWDPSKNVCEKDDFGCFKCFIPDGPKGKPGIHHLSKIKARLTFPSGEQADRIPAWCSYVVQQEHTVLYDGVYWNPPEPYQWKNPRLQCSEDLRIYESHVGMASIHGKVASYKEFTRDILTRIKRLGYNAVQLMAIMEHAYYASFGYHVTNFFGASSRYGTPDDLKELVDTAHGMGISVIMDVIHSHASKNILDGINHFDGTDNHYFHAGGKGEHSLWDSRIFDYGKHEVLRFLLSNCRWWVEEYRMDGFRFDGVTSMLYNHHGIGFGFSGDYHEYFGERSNVDVDAICYLTLVNDLLHSLDPPVLTIAEDVSGMPGLCRPVQEGGIGFDYRLAMAIPDHWIKIIKEKRDEDWDINLMVHQLTNRRYSEKAIAYAESHDQALVGDKTLAFRLMDKEMYDWMSISKPLTPLTDRGIALHKMIRLLTYSLGGEGYLNFMGNEFGHPEWIDFPREGNNTSYHHCRRQWNLVDHPDLRYQHLNNFDIAMHTLEQQYKWLSRRDYYVVLKDEGRKLIAFEKAGLFWVFNFHPTESYHDHKIGTHHPGIYEIVLDSDDWVYGGHSRLDHRVRFHTSQDHSDNCWNSIQVYAPCRTCVVYALEKESKGYVCPQ